MALRVRSDVVVLVAILALATYAVVWQSSTDRVTTLAVGEKADDFRLLTVSGEPISLTELKTVTSLDPRRTPVKAKAIVLYFWSVSCPCIDAIEHRMKQVLERFPYEKGFQYVAIDADPTDTPEAIVSKMGRLHAFYRMLVDPTQTTAARLGGTSSGEVVVLDGDLRLRYRGAIDDDLRKPKRFYLMEVLEAIEAGRPYEPRETPGYGCPYPGIEGVCATEEASES